VHLCSLQYRSSQCLNRRLFGLPLSLTPCIDLTDTLRTVLIFLKLIFKCLLFDDYEGKPCCIPPNAAALTGTNTWRDSNAGNSLFDPQDVQPTRASASAALLSAAMVLHDDPALHHARGTRSDQVSDVGETIVLASEEVDDTEERNNTTTKSIETSRDQAASTLAKDHSHSPPNEMKVDQEHNSEVGFYKQIQGVHCTVGQGQRVATAVAHPPTLDNITDSFVPAVAVMDEREDPLYPPLPTQVAEGEAATTYNLTGSRIDSSSPSGWMQRIDCGHFRWSWLGAIGMLIAVALVVTAGLCGRGNCSSMDDDKKAPQPGPLRNTSNPDVSINDTVRQPISRNKTDPSTGLNIVTPIDVISNYSHLATFTRALNLTGLTLELCLFDCNYTVFAPVDSAFEVLGAKFTAKIWTPRWIMHLRAIVKNHVTEPSAQHIMTKDFVHGMTIPMLSGENVTGSKDSNGTVVLASAGTNASTITPSDALVARNGVVHQVNKLLLPSFMTTNLIGLINATVGQEFSISAAFLLKLGLNPLISNFEDVTILAPANEAFQELSEEVLASLQSNNEYLTAVLSNHLVFGVVPTVSIAHGQSYTTLSGQDVHFLYTDKNTLMVNDANIIKSDILATNGILHIIDKILLEPYTPPSGPVLAENSVTDPIDTSSVRAVSVSVFTLLVVVLACWSW
jgi:transforming growth factor-beta-induced protein